MVLRRADGGQRRLSGDVHGWESKPRTRTQTHHEAKPFLYFRASAIVVAATGLAMLRREILRGVLLFPHETAMAVVYRQPFPRPFMWLLRIDRPSNTSSAGTLGAGSA